MHIGSPVIMISARVAQAVLPTHSIPSDEHLTYLGTQSRSLLSKKVEVKYSKVIIDY